MDLRDTKNIDVFMDGLFDSIRATFEQSNEVHPMAIVAGDAHPDGTAADDVQFYCVMSDGQDFSPRVRDGFRDELANLCRKVKAFAVLFVSESWYVVTKDLDSIQTPIANRLDRREAVTVMFEHAAEPHARMYCADIHEVDGKRTIQGGKIEPKTGPLGGRSSGLLARHDKNVN